jgi:hypothetical protein
MDPGSEAGMTSGVEDTSCDAPKDGPIKSGHDENKT